MKIQPQLLDGIRKAVAEVAGPDMIRITDDGLFAGPSPYSSEPVMLLTIAAEPAALSRGALQARAWSAFPDLEPMPADDPDGPADAQAMADCAAQLAARLLSRGLRVQRRAGIVAGKPGEATFWLEYLTGRPALEAVKIALIAVAAAACGSDRPVPPRHLKRLDQVCAQQRPNFSSKILLTAARARDIPFLPIADQPSLWQFGWGSRSLAFWETSSNGDGLLAWHFSHSKDTTKKMFRQLGVPTPIGQLIGRGQDPMPAIRVTGWPCAVKPADRGGGRGVSAKVESEPDLRRAVEVARGFSDQVLIETHVPGTDYRLMVIDGRLVAACRREPPAVTGDGKSSVNALLAHLNEGRDEILDRGSYLTRVKPDEAVTATLAQQGLTPDSVVADGRTVLLRSNANRTTGGTAHDVLDSVHPEVRRMAEELAAAFGFRVTGVDYICSDITRSPAETGGAFIEMNATAGLAVHLASGMSEEEVGSLVLGEKPGRIPVELVIVPEERHAAFQAMLAEQMQGQEGIGAAGVGWTRIGSFALPDTGLTPFEAVRSLLRRPTVERVVIVWSDEQLRRFGLPVDRVASTLVAETKLPKEWHALLERCSEQFATARNVDEALARISMQAPKGEARPIPSPAATR